MPKRFTTIEDAIERDILPTLDEKGDLYDVRAIAFATYDYRVDRDERGNELLHTAGFELAVGVEQFWAIVDRFEI